MPDVALRSKDEIAREIEQDREEVSYVLHQTRDVWARPAVRAWQATQSRYQDARAKVTCRAQAADVEMRLHTYRYLAIALGLGFVASWLMKRKPRSSRRCY